MSEYILEMRNIDKSFPGVHALKSVNLRIRKNEVHCLLGENGAGKSTLIKILAGAYSMDSGEILFDGRPVEIRKPEDALSLGISFIFQELNTVNELTVEENVTLGAECTIQKFFIDKRKNKAIVQKILDRLNMTLDVDEKTKELSTSQKQMMMIAKAMSKDTKLIVMDEPTAALTDRETEALFSIVRDLKTRGVSFLFVSHRLPDIFAIGDNISVFRDGESVAEDAVADIDPDWIISNMVGREIDQIYPMIHREFGETLLEAENISAENLIQNVSFTLRAGEVLGVSGLAGAGKTELAQSLFGVNPLTGGQVKICGKKVNLSSPEIAMRHHIAYVPEERRAQGIVADMSVCENLTLALKNKVSRFGWVNQKECKRITEESIARYLIKTPSMDQKIKLLSGGNQQKVIIAKWLNTDASVILLDEPTRGIDVGAKREIYDLINAITKDNRGVMMFSSELPELIGICDRILVMREGRMVGILEGEDITQEQIMNLSVQGGCQNENES